MQFRDLKAQYEKYKNEIDNAIQEVLNSTSFIGGKEVGDLEKQLAEYIGVKHCISCANGTDALQLVLMAWGVGMGDAVFTSDFTFFASAGCASIFGATPVFVDIDPITFNIDTKDLERKIEKVKLEGKLKPRVIIPVDLFGLPANLPEIERIAKRHDLMVLEDAAQGFGGEIDGKHACSFGDASITSFFPAKPLGCYGDGGAIFTNDGELDILLRSLRAQGRSPSDKYDNRLIGMNSRLDTIQAAILLKKLKAFIDFEMDAVNQIAKWYTERLSNIVETPVVPEGYLSSWAQYTIKLKDEVQRNALQTYLKNNAIPSMIYYPRGLHQQTAYLHMNLNDSDYPNTVSSTKRVLSLPMHPYLSKEDVYKIADTIIDFLSSKA